MPQLDFVFLGDCFNLAIALNRKLKAPICILYGERWTTSPPQNVVIHAGVLLNGLFYDETGCQGYPEELLKEFLYHNEPYDKTKIFEYEDENDPHLKEIFSISNANVSEDKILFFMNWIEQNFFLFHKN